MRIGVQIEVERQSAKLLGGSRKVALKNLPHHVFYLYERLPLLTKAVTFKA